MMQDLSEKLETDWLLTIYGPLLTDNQRRIAEMYYAEDLGISEIASVENVSRQCVHETLHRVDVQLHQLENLLHTRSAVQKACDLLHQIELAAQDSATDPEQKARQITTLCKTAADVLTEHRLNA